MAQWNIAQVATRPQAPAEPESIRAWLRLRPVQLLAVLFLVETIIPFFIWLGFPGALDFIGEIIAGFMALVVVLHMLAKDNFPIGVFVVLAMTLIWGMVALFEGQDVVATAWGWWKMFKYPVVGLYAYLMVPWPKDFPRWALKFLIGLMLVEVGVQLLQYAMGEPPGDSLAGTFGPKGMGPQTLFNFLVIALAFGNWMVTRTWKWLLLSLAAGLAASLLNLTKFYIPAIVIMGIAAVGLSLIRGGQFRQLWLFVFLFAGLLAIFVPVFNTFIADARDLPRLQEYLEPERLDKYLNNDGKGDVDGQYNLGRSLSVSYAWNTIRKDMTSTLFGMGLGVRSYSTGLGIQGIAAETDLYSRLSGTSLLTLLQELGVVGLLLMGLLNFWVMWALFRDAKSHNDDDLQVLEYGLILFSLLWLVWIWYQKAWFHATLNISYWVLLAYCFHRIKLHKQEAAARRRPLNGRTAWPLQGQDRS